MKINWKKIVPYLVALVVFLGLTISYMSPLLEGKVLQAGDVNSWKCAANEAREYRAETGEVSWWSNSMFGGMPTYQTTGAMPSTALSNNLLKVFYLGFNEPLNKLLGYFVGFFLMLICFGVNPWLALVGSLAISFSSYFFIIIPAGHMTKAAALGILAPVFGGFYALFRKKYWLGGILIALFSTLGMVQHPQMTYYICMLIGVCGIAELVVHIKEKRWKDLGVALGILAVALLLAFGTKFSWMKNNTEYLAETMRGGHSELTQKNDEQPKKAGLDIDYATAWSYGIDETLTLLIPNSKGGSSHYAVSKNSELYKTLINNGVPKNYAENLCQALPMYWGTQPFTAGPVYVGAIVFFLFILGLFIVKSPYKWALLAATIFSILLAWGRNFMPFTELFFNYFPMYNKFRAVSSILVVAEITMPLLGFLALQKIFDEVKNKSFNLKTQKAIYWSAGITAGVCLFLALFGGLLWNFTSPNDAQVLSQMPDWFRNAIVDERKNMLTADAWRSLVFVALAAVLLWFFQKGKLKNGYFIALLAVLVTVDMWGVDKRFFNEKNFVSPKDDKAYFAAQPYETQILEDKTLNFRVLNLATNTFNDARTSYRLKSVGGYSAVKLRRYQDLIDAHISQNNQAVLDMLNTRYFITRNGTAVQNPNAMGNAWLVDSLLFVDTPNEESDALWNIDLHTTAVADKKFENILKTNLLTKGEITLTDYRPSRLTYEVSVSGEKTAVFSEIFYPHGWHAYIDGNEVPIGRVNYVLRAITIPAGNHTIMMEFVPDALKLDKFSLTCVILVILLTLGGIGLAIYKVYTKGKKA